MDKIIYGADSETIAGKPLSLQFYSNDVACEQIFFVNADTARKKFVEWIKSRKRNAQHVVYVHNLAFDLIEFLWGRHHLLVSSGGDYAFKMDRLHISGVYGTPTFCRITNGHDLSVMFVDSFSYFRESLHSAALRVCPDLPKLKRIHGLGSKRFTAKDSDFVDYAMRDAVVAYHLGKAIEAMHQRYDVRQCVSVADMAAQVFRRNYMRPDMIIPQPSREIVEAALLSYHGGKNNITVEAGWYEGVSSIDISSAFPEALHAMPSFTQAGLYKRYNAKGKVKSVPNFGVYLVSGVTKDCRFPVLYSHAFKPLKGAIDRVWVQGFELNEALVSGEFRPVKITGHYYDEEKDHVAPPLRAYVEDMYKLKETSKTKVERSMHKLLLNSLYGKFIQTRKSNTEAFTDVDAGVTVPASDLKAGGMFHPFIASACTARPRARIHRIEHKYKALHTATDGVFTQEPVRYLRAKSEADLYPVKKATLGALTLEAKECTLLLLRNKLYVLYGPKTEHTTPSLVFKGQHIVKYAKHGFQGSVTDLEKMAATGKRSYEVTKPYRLKEALNRGETPNDFVKQTKRLNIGSIPVRRKKR